MKTRTEIRLMPDYSEKLCWVMNLVKEYGLEVVMVTPENWEECKKMPNFDGEPDDHMDDYIHRSLIIQGKKTLSIGRMQYEIRSIFIDTENSWCQWKLSLVQDAWTYGRDRFAAQPLKLKTKQWFSMDARLLVIE